MQRLVQANDLLNPVSELAGVGPKRQRLLARLGITRVGDLLHHFPRRYEDLRWDGRLESLRQRSHSSRSPLPVSRRNTSSRFAGRLTS